MNGRKPNLLWLTVMCLLITGCSRQIIQTDQPQSIPDISTTAERTSDTAETRMETISPGLSNQKLLSNITIEKGFAVADYGESSGEDYSYAVYQFARTDQPVNERDMYWEILVMDGEQLVTVLRIDREEHGNAFPQPSDLVLEYDVNFDGVNDILLCLGHFGAQGSVSYKCFLAEGNTFTHCPSFSRIPNPAINSNEKVVRGWWRNWAASHSWAVYTCQDQTFVETERLTESLALLEDGTELWTWKDEVFKDGEWQIREAYTEQDYDAETLARKHYGPDSYWRLDQDIWNTLFNSGSMSDSSLYGD